MNTPDSTRVIEGDEGCRSAGDIFEKWPEDKSGCIRWDKEIATSLLESAVFFFQVPISIDCVFDASLVPETCLELPCLSV